MVRTRLTRRSLLLATSGVRLAGNNVATALRDLRCPGCGEPLIRARA